MTGVDPFPEPTIVPHGDAALMVVWPGGVDEATRRRVADATRAIRADPFPGLIELVPGFTTVTAFYAPHRVLQRDATNRSPFEAARDHVRRALTRRVSIAEAPARTVVIPVCYEQEFGPDLEFVAQHSGLTPDQVIERHTAGHYRVHMLGFSPGFGYLGGLAAEIAVPRHATPRTRVPSGSVGIGGPQTGVYPIESPGGWRLIGRTPSTMFDPRRRPPTLLETGDEVRFRAIPRAEFDRLRQEST